MKFPLLLHQVSLVFGLIILSLLPVHAQSGPIAKPYIRKSAYSSSAAKDLEALQMAIGKMKKLPCTNPLSWYYQGAMHWVPDTVLKNPYCPSYQYSNKDLKTAWDNCTHNEASTTEYNFVIWHRLYIYHFEKIIRKISGKADFALPYWGYTDSTNARQSHTLPLVFRQKASSLYEASRLDSMNQGLPISGAALFYFTDPYLNTLFENTQYDLFNEGMDGAPHGALHNYVGSGNNNAMMFNPIYQAQNNGLMAQVASAAFDPIFWLHHANIDRLWQQWTDQEANNPNAKISLDGLKANPFSYQFFDENGKLINYTPESIVNMIYKLDYRYDDQKTKSRPITLAVNQLERAQPEPVLQATINQPVSTTPLSFTVRNSNQERTKNLVLLNKSTNSGRTVILTVKASFDQEPKGNYEVYVNQAEGDKPTGNTNTLAGIMNFFGAAHHHSTSAGSGQHNHDGSTSTRISKTFRFDVTDEFQATNALQNDQFRISVFKRGGLDQESITINEVTVSIR